MLTNSIEIIKLWCRRSRQFFPFAETPQHLLIGIRGLCTGLGDSRAERCLGDFPLYVQQRLPNQDSESWYDTLFQLSEGKSFSQYAEFLLDLIDQWERDSTVSPMPVPPTEHPVVDDGKFQLLEDLFRRPRYYVPAATSLQDLLVFMGAILVSCAPPHGSTSEVWEFGEYLKQRFPEFPHGPLAYRFLKLFGNRPFLEAAGVIADLLASWRATSPKQKGGE